MSVNIQQAMAEIAACQRVYRVFADVENVLAVLANADQVATELNAAADAARKAHDEAQAQLQVALADLATARDEAARTVADAKEQAKRLIGEAKDKAATRAEADAKVAAERAEALADTEAKLEAARAALASANAELADLAPRVTEARRIAAAVAGA